MIFLRLCLKACISSKDIHPIMYPNDKKIVSNNAIASTTENTVPRVNSCMNIENVLNEHRDSLSKELRLEMLRHMESFEKRIELKFIKMFQSFKEQMK